MCRNCCVFGAMVTTLPAGFKQLWQHAATAWQRFLQQLQAALLHVHPKLDSVVSTELVLAPSLLPALRLLR